MMISIENACRSKLESYGNQIHGLMIRVILGVDCNNILKTDCICLPLTGFSLVEDFLLGN